MTANLKSESRTGKLSCTTLELFGFVTDIRNFEQFIPEGSIKDWRASSENCSFQVPPMGSANVRISEKIPVSLVKYTGDAMQNNKFELVVHISENAEKLAEVKLNLTAELNPFLRVLASGPIERFLGTLISEMEKFENWNLKSK